MKTIPSTLKKNDNAKVKASKNPKTHDYHTNLTNDKKISGRKVTKQNKDDERRNNFTNKKNTNHKNKQLNDPITPSKSVPKEQKTVRKNLFPVTNSKHSKSVIKRSKSDNTEQKLNKLKQKYSGIQSKVKLNLDKQKEEAKNKSTQPVQEIKKKEVIDRTKIKSKKDTIFQRSAKKSKKAETNLDEKLQKIIKSASKDNYLGKGPEGLNELDDIHSEDMDLVTGITEHNLINELNSKVPCFSEGYYNQSDETLNKEGQDPASLQTANKKDLTPGRVITNKLTTAVKSSLRKRIPLDTELKFLSKEFRFLLSDRKQDAEELMKLKEEVVEKKLDFNDKMIVEEEEVQSEKESLSEEEVEKLENDILLKVLEENFGHKTFLPGQINTIKNVLNGKNFLTILPPNGGKSLCYQLPAMVLEGLTIVICPSLSLITDGIMNLPQNLSGASLTSLTTQKQRNEIFDAIKDQRIKILFITPERFAIENLSEIEEISLVCFEDATSTLPISNNYRSSYFTIQNIISQLKPMPLLFLTNNICKTYEKALISQYNIDGVIRESIVFNNVRISVTKDDNKFSATLKLLRIQQSKNCSGPTLIYCNTKKTVDKLTSFLNQNGLSASSYHHGKEDLERQVIQANFMNDKIKILICSVGMNISKKDIRNVIVFDLPSSLEILLQQIGKAGKDKKEAFVHVFLNDEDYFTQRNLIYAENVDKNQLYKFAEYIFANNKSLKRTISEIDKTFDVPPITDIEQQSNSRTISFNYSKMQEKFGLKKQLQLYLTLCLLDETFLNKINNEHDKVELKCKGIGPTVIYLRFYKTPHDILSQVETNIRFILESAREFSGAYRFNTLEVCEKIGINYTDLIYYLYHLQSIGEIGYECKEEGIFLNITNSLTTEKIKQVSELLHDKVQELINVNLRKLNSSYVLLRQFAINSIDLLTKNDKNSSVKCLQMYSDIKAYNDDMKGKLAKYFEFELYGKH